jgi:hypothetical protein
LNSARKRRSVVPKSCGSCSEVMPVRFALLRAKINNQ